MSYLLLICADILLALNFVCVKKYQQLKGVSAKAGFFFILFSGLFTTIIFLAINHFKLSVAPYSLIMSFITNALCIGYTLLGYRIMRSGTLAIYTLFLMSGGMIVPYIWGVLFLNEPLSVIRTIGLILILFSVILTNRVTSKIQYKFLFMCAAVFFLNGFVSVVSKIHQTENLLPTVSTTDFVILGGILKSFIGVTCYLAIRNHSDNDFDNNNIGIKPVLLLILASAIFSGTSSILQLHGAKDIPATVLYPFITGGSIIFTSLAGVITFKEKLSKEIIASIAICFVGTLLFL